MTYKTPELQRLLSYLCDRYPTHKNELMQTESKLMNIDLSPPHNASDEIFIQNINLVTKETIKLTWNVDLIIKYINTHQNLIKKDNPERIYQSARFDFSGAVYEQIYEAVADSLKENRVYVHKTDYVIFANVPFVKGYTLIDGNHRFFEAFIQKKTLKYVCISGEECVSFLHKESQKFIQTFALINKIIFD